MATLVNRNRSLRQVNRWYDRLTAIGRKAQITIEPPSRKALKRVRDLPDIEELERRLEEVTFGRWLGIAIGHRGIITEMIPEIALLRYYPAFTRISDEADEAFMRGRLERAALALIGYQVKHGTYPESLDALIPAWFESVPEDVFADGKPVQYQLTEEHVTIYSVGANGEDDRGKKADSTYEGDLVLEWDRLEAEQ